MPAFDVTAIPTQLTLKAGDKGRFVVKATSKMSRRVTARVEVAAAPEDYATWFRPVDETQRIFAAVNTTHDFTFDVAVPAGQAAVSLTCTPSVVDVEAPEDNYGVGTAIAVTVTAAAAPPPPTAKKFPIWVIPVAALVLIGAGIGIWRLLNGGGGEMPDLVTRPFGEAEATLQQEGVVVVRHDSLSAVGDTVRFPAGAVMAQSPAAGTKLEGSEEKPDTARLVVQRDFTVVPPGLVDATPVDAASRLGLAGLAVRSRAVTVREQAHMGKVRSTTPTSGVLAVVGDTVTIGVGARLCPAGRICPFRPTLAPDVEAAVANANKERLGAALQARKQRPPGGG